MSFIKNLQKNVNKVAEGYYANWTPDMPVAVGDFGSIRGYRFTRDGNISGYNIGAEVEETCTLTATLEMKDGVTIGISPFGSGGASGHRVKLDLQFGGEGSFLYHLVDITHNQFKDRREAFEKIGQMILSQAIQWNDDYVLVTEVKQSGKAIIFVSDSSKASVQISIKSEIPGNFNLAGAEGGFAFIRDSSRLIKFTVENKVPHLFRIVEFVWGETDDGPRWKLNQAVETIRQWFFGSLPKPEAINLSEYVENQGEAQGTFVFDNGMSILMIQKSVDIDSFIRKSEEEHALGTEAEVANSGYAGMV